MRLYHFKQDSYSVEFTLMAGCKAGAIQSLLRYLDKKSLESDEGDSFYSDLYAEFDDAYKNGKLPPGYCLQAFNIGHVIETEVS